MKKREAKITLTKDQKAGAVADIKAFMEEDYDIELGNLESERFLDFLTEKVGIHYYNAGVEDSRKLIIDRTDDLYLLMKD